MDLTYTNRAGISLQNVLDILDKKNESVPKKDIQTDLDTTKSIDTLLKKLEDASLIEKQKSGNKLLYSLLKKDVSKKETSTKRTLHKSKPTRTKSPAEVDKINKQTENINKEYQITSLVEIDEEKPRSEKKSKSIEVNQNDLDLLKKEMESKLGKEVTAVLHKRNEKAIKERKQTAQKIYEQQQEKIKKDSEEYEKDNPYRFVLNFFVSTLNGEKATPYFRRRDEYVVKSIFNKFNSLCEPMDDYNVSPQNLPFYRVITLNMKENVVKMYHIDINRIVRGVYTLFKLNAFDDKFIKFND